MLDVTAPLSDAGPQQVAMPAPADHRISFHEVLSALNPLQYLPVIGTIYRAVTGDQIPEAVRRIGSLIVSGLLGGPIGIAINLAVTFAEKITGIDLDQTGQMLLAGTAPEARHVANPAPASAPVQRAEAPAPSASSPVQAWSPAQLAAYGVRTAGDGDLNLADLCGADVLNTLELIHIQRAQVAYGQAVQLAG
jgi:hypothetical protein